MKIENILFWVIMIGMLAYSCSKDIPPSFLSGKYDAFSYEIQDCTDPSVNVSVDLRNPDSIYMLNCDTIIVSCDTMFFFNIDTLIYSDSMIIDTIIIDSMIIDSIVMDTLVRDTVIECIEALVNCDEAIYNFVTFEFDSVGNYELIVDRIFNGVSEVETTSGNYISTGFNDINICETNCLDSIWSPGVFVRNDRGELNVAWRDTLGTQCGFLFQGERID